VVHSQAFNQMSMFRLVTTFSLLLLGSNCAAQQPWVSAPHKPVPPRLSKPLPYPYPAVLRSVAGGLWMTDGNFKSSIYLKNGLVTSALEVTPILYLANGTKLPLAAVHLEPAGTATVDINQSLADNGIAPYAQLSGYLEVEYKWPWDVLCVTIHNVDIAHSLIFNFNLGVPLLAGAVLPERSAEKSEILEGMWWKETKDLTGFVALSNPTEEPRSATVAVSDSFGKPIEKHAVIVSPHGTKLVALSELRNAPGVSGGISISYQGPEDAIVVTGGLEDQTTGFSANIPFTDPAPNAPRDSTSTEPSTFNLAELGLMAGIADPMMRFPSGTVFTPYTVMRNPSPQTIPVKPAVYWMDSTGPRSAILPQFSLSPHQALSLDVVSMMASVGLKNFNGSVDLILEVPESSRSTLIVACGSIDQKKNYVFGVMPTLVAESESKTLSYWSTADGDDTMVTVWSPADEEQELIFTVSFSGGHYLMPLHLSPKATRTFNISEIIHNQIPDSEGNVIPISVHEGSAQISGSQGEAEWILVAMDFSIYNVQKATCGFTCASCGGDTSVILAASPFAVPQSATTQERFIGNRHDGTQVDHTSAASWNSSDTNVATVNQGLVTGRAAGALTLNASLLEVQYLPYGCRSEWHGCQNLLQKASAPGKTQVPTLLSGPALDSGTTYTGQPLTDCAGNQRLPAFWGYRYCGTYTVLDQNNATIKKSGIPFTETIEVVHSSAGNPTIVTGTATTNSAGQFLDTLAFGFPNPPGPQIQDFVTNKQTIQWKANTVRINCVQFISQPPPEIKDITIPSSGTCP
jgi:hypothetical protein